MDKPEALRLADALDAWDGKLMMPKGWRESTAAELRRLHAQRDALLEALRAMRVKYGQYACRVCDLADAAIAKAEEKT